MITACACSQAVQVGDTVYVSGVLGLNKDTMKLVEGGATHETELALTNLGHILAAADSNYSKGRLYNPVAYKIVKTQIFCFIIIIWSLLANTRSTL